MCSYIHSLLFSFWLAASFCLISEPFFYPYGESEGDVQVPAAIDGSSPPVMPSQPFPFFRSKEVIFYVCGLGFCICGVFSVKKGMYYIYLNIYMYIDMPSHPGKHKWNYLFSEFLPFICTITFSN